MMIYLCLFESGYTQDPDLTRVGGSIPVAESLGVNVFLPMGRGDDGAQ